MFIGKRGRQVLLAVLGIALLLFAIGCSGPGGTTAPTQPSPNDDSATDDGNQTRSLPATQQFKWTMQSYGIAGTEPHEIVQQGIDRLRVISGGRLDIELHPGGALMGYAEMLEAVQTGALELSFNASSFFIGQDPAFAAWFDMPGVLPQDSRLARHLKREWQYAEGIEIGRELYAQYNNYLVGAALMMNEPIHSKDPIRTLDDFKGKKFRAAPGLIQEMFERVGAIPIAMPGGEIYSALDTGVIDGAEFVGFTENFGLGIHEVTNYVLYPGFHSQVPLGDLAVNQDKWNELPEDLQLLLEDFLVWVDARTDYVVQQRDLEVIEILKHDFGVEHVVLPLEEQQQVQRLGAQLTREWADKSPLSRKMIDSMFAFLDRTGYAPPQ